ncbi:MAG: L,D-transpeptidase [Limosilactobacillus sp.]|jgi:lipoprotein-anchoring transpeptidase ErfK/SrfK|uniref:L,D-transpeptidase n=1 Tax=Limosilactobacillus sp. TaxID=2773925 RepID=UPI0025C5B7CE|nr:L,D-transpeptidase [Limosilactobacillus sp.]MCI1974346.1 L,D-transpeptidase [Limosilactobacillus sp.]MCI2030461.1 L,D-transpeptidase [Limosilactobacillus sp.]
MKKSRYVIYALFCLIIAMIELHSSLNTKADQSTSSATVTKKVAQQQKTSSNSKMRTPIDWQKSSETKAYPDVSKLKHFWIKVDLKANRTYLYDGKHVVYTMYSTGGIYKKDPKTGKMKSMTPTGTFYVQQERGDSFYNARLKEGANYYTSWLNHGEYLFHSVPTNSDGSYNKKEAAKLGKSTGSHGCIRLSVADARWMEENLPVGTKVEIVG